MEQVFSRQATVSQYICCRICNWARWTNSITVGGAGTDVPPITKLAQIISSRSCTRKQLRNVSSGQSISSTVGGKDILLLKALLHYLSHRIIGWVMILGTYRVDSICCSYRSYGRRTLGGHNTIGQNGQNNLLLAKIDQSGQGNDKFLLSNGSGSSDGRGNGITNIGNDSLILGGRLAPGTTYIDGNNVGGTTETGVILMFVKM